MATIDGTEFHLTGFSIAGNIKYSLSAPPGSDINPNCDLGAGSLELNVSGIETTRTKYDEVLGIFLAPGVHELILDSGWKYYVQRARYEHNRFISPEQTIFPYSLSLIAEDSFLYSTTEITRTRTIHGTAYEWSADDDGNSIETTGNVYARPSVILDSSRDDVDIEDSVTPPYYGTSNPVDYQLLYTHTFSAAVGRKRRLDEIYFTAKCYPGPDTVYYKVTVTAASINGGAEYTVKEDSFVAAAWGSSETEVSYDCSGDALLTAENEQMVVKYYFKVASDQVTIFDAISTATAIFEAENIEQDDTDQNTASYTYVLLYTHTFAAVANYKHCLNSTYFEFDNQYSDPAHPSYEIGYKITVTTAAINSGSEYTIKESTASANDFDPKTTVTDNYTDVIAGENEQMVVKYYFKKIDVATYDLYVYDTISTATDYLKLKASDITVFNTVDDTVVCNVCGDIFPDIVISVNADGTGTFSYADDLTTDKSIYYCEKHLNCAWSSTKISIADDGYIYFAIETYYPIISIPILTAAINITSGTPTIQIAYDSAGSPGTFYDIDTAIIDNVETEYQLISGSDVVLAGKTKFWLRVDCTGTGTVTAEIESFELDIDFISIDAQMPKIETGGANTFQSDQSSDGELEFTIGLLYEHRKWA